MTLALKRLKVYGKVIAISAVGAVAALVVIKNQKYTADFWFFRVYNDVPVLWLTLITAVVAVVGWWGTLRVFGVLRELREVKRAREAQRQLAEQRRLAEQLAERERRIDEKIRRSIAGDSSTHGYP